MASSIRSITLLLILMVPFKSYAVFEPPEPGARARAMGKAYTGAADEVSSLFWNTGALGFLKRPEVFTSYSRSFGMSELDRESFASCFPSRWGTVGIGLTGYGFNLYKETVATVSFNRRIKQDIGLGLSLRGTQLAIKTFGSARSLCLDVGFLGRVRPNLYWGIVFWNMNNAKIGTEGERIAQLLAMGFAFRPYENLLLTVDSRKDLQSSLEIRAGMEYRILPKLALRLGVDGSTPQFSGGLGLSFNRISFDYSITDHLVLGFSQEVSLRFR